MMPRCLGCDYLLHGLPENRCPECGRPFDPARPETMAVRRPLGAVGRAIFRPIPWWLVTIGLLPAAWLLYRGLHPSFYYMMQPVLLVLLWLLSLWVMSLRFAMLEAARSYYRNRRPTPPERRRWGVFWGVTILVTLLLAFEVPVRVGFLWARPALEQLLAEVQADPAPQPVLSAPRRAGMWHIHPQWGIRRQQPDMILFMLAGDLESGFAWSPNQVPIYNTGTHRYLGDGWYRIAED